MNQPFWNRRTCVILTGGSKGIGQNLAVEISKILVPESTIILIARDTNGLEKTKEMVLKKNGNILIEVIKINHIRIQFIISISNGVFVNTVWIRLPTG